MPWGHPEALEALWCVPCGVEGREWRQRRMLGVDAAPTPRVRCCPGCYAKGWRLFGPGVEEGRFFVAFPDGMRRRVRHLELVESGA